MTTHPSFLAAIIEEPAEDVHRLVYADWLEENGEPEHAEFIRVQCELVDARPWPPMDLDKRMRLEKRERELLYATRRTNEWSGFPLALQPPVALWHFSRGFVSSLTCTSADFLTHAAAILSAQPIERVTLTDWEVVQHADANDFETDHFEMRVNSTLGAGWQEQLRNFGNGHTLLLRLRQWGWIPPLCKDAAEALATFSQTLILWGRARIKSTAPLPLG